MFAQFKRLTWKTSLLATAISLLAFSVALAAAGDLDTTFDGGGWVTSHAVPSNPVRWDIAPGLAIQADGKIVAAGYSYLPSTATRDFALTRHNTDGTLDTTFSGDGRQLTDLGALDQGFDVAVQANGRIVVAGQTCFSGGAICDVALVRYQAGGTLDATFSGDGKQTSDFGGDDNGSYGGLAIQSNGKIVVAGYMWNGSNYDFAVYRYLSNGTLDTTFSGDGMANFGFGGGRQDYATDLVIQSDGKIVVAGYSGDANFDNNNFAVARLNPGGFLDATFSGDGKQITNQGANDYASAVALQTDGKIVVAGEKDAEALDVFALARYNTDGSPDTTFNGGGRKAFSIIASRDSWASDVIVQSDGKIVVLGTASNAGSLVFALVRLNPGGSFDTAFNGDGKVTVDLVGGDEIGRALLVQPLDGRYVLGGDMTDCTQVDFALARVLP